MSLAGSSIHPLIQSETQSFWNRKGPWFHLVNVAIGYAVRDSLLNTAFLYYSSNLNPAAHVCLWIAKRVCVEIFLSEKCKCYPRENVSGSKNVEGYQPRGPTCA